MTNQKLPIDLRGVPINVGDFVLTKSYGNFDFDAIRKVIGQTNPRVHDPEALVEDWEYKTHLEPLRSILNYEARTNWILQPNIEVIPSKPLKRHRYQLLVINDLLTPEEKQIYEENTKQHRN